MSEEWVIRQEAAERFTRWADQVHVVLVGVERDYVWYQGHYGGLNTLGQELFVCTCRALVFVQKCLLWRAKTLAPAAMPVLPDPTAEPVLLLAE